MKIQFPVIYFWKPVVIGISIVLLCLVPSSELKKIGVPEITFADLIVHTIMFLVFSVFLLNDLIRHAKKPDTLWRSIIIAGFISLSLGIATELMQLLLTSLNRTASLSDLLFDCAGFIAGMVLIRLIRKRSDPVI